MTTGSLFPSVSKYLFSFSRKRCNSTRTIELVVGSKSEGRPRASTPMLYSLSSSNLPSKYFEQRNWSSRPRLGDFEKVVEDRTNFSSARSCWAPGRRVMGTQLSTKTRAAKCRQTATPKPRNVHGNRLMDGLLTLSQSRKMPHRSRKKPQS